MNNLYSGLDLVRCILSFGEFPGAWILRTDFSGHCQFHLHRRCKQASWLWKFNWQSALKRRHINFRKRGITQ